MRERRERKTEREGKGEGAGKEGEKGRRESNEAGKKLHSLPLLVANFFFSVPVYRTSCLSLAMCFYARI